MSTAEQGYLFDNLRKVITLVDKLRDLGLNKYISLPRVAVLGSQSAGKSSLLEQIVGLDFLPRGSGVVTRRPLEMRLVYVHKDLIKKPYATFEELPDQKFEDFQQVKKNIEILTDKVAGSNKGIVDKPIILKIYSSTCPDLTMIDLPGITRIPLRGSEQPENIEQITKEMATRYCSDETTIILCVIPANQDISTSEALQMSRLLDPEGKRTLGVITKIDIMDQGTDARKLLLGQDIELNLGYVGVMNRTNQDIQNGKPVLKHLEDEKKFFASHPVYSTLPEKHCGSSSLTKRVTEIFYIHIRNYLPKIDQEMNNQLKEKEDKLAKLGTPLPESDSERIQFLWKTVNEFITQFKASLDGNYHKTSRKINVPVGSSIRQILEELYQDHVSQKICERYSDRDIEKAVQLHEGDSIPGFPSLDAFMSLLVPQLRTLIDPALDCINDVYFMLEELTDDILEDILEKLPSLKQEIRDSIIGELQNERENTKNVVEDLLQSEINYVFTNDNEFLIKGGFDRPEKVNPSQTGQQQQSKPMILQLRQRIDSYFDVVIRSIRDSVPKMIGNFLVKKIQSQLRFTLFKTVNDGQKYFKHMNEPEFIVQERKHLRDIIQTMKAAKQTIRKDPDLAYMFRDQSSLMDKQNEMSKVNAKQAKQVFKSGNQHQHHHSQHQSQQQVHNQEKRHQHSNSTQNSSNNNNQTITNSNTNLQKPIQQNAINNMFGQPSSSQPKTQQSQPQQQQLKSNMFGDSKKQPQQPQQNQNQSQSQNKAAANNLFGNPSPSNNQQAQQQQLQQEQQKQQANNNLFGNAAIQQPQKQGFVDNGIDKGVDKMMANKGVQDGMKKGANQATQAAVNNYIPGNAKAAEFMGKQAEKVVANEKVQNEIKNQAKTQAKKEAKKNPLQFW